jgi:hypothetical protein
MQLKLEDLLDRIGKHILELKSRLASRQISGAPATPFHKYTVQPWRVFKQKSLFVEELEDAQLMLVEVSSSPKCMGCAKNKNCAESRRNIKLI